ncbi:MAG: methionyl-tRNA formyltransferase [Gemmatimonadaceae bacterium]|jgi:methionyl-tRNA formyltransferase|nr:methionyl-tRNA formyltransferase [Gemmatimonadaceae bacterium]
MRILFWGTPDFAVPPLRALLGEGFDVVGVVTQPDKPRGRSRSQLDPSPVKQVALEEGIPVWQPERPRGDAFLAELRALAPDVSVVVAYGHILPQAVIDVPRLGTLNIHASLLPALRGADPIRAAIKQGLSETGVSIMRMVLAMDAGPVLLRLPTPVAEDETYGELSVRLAELGALGIVQALMLVDAGLAAAEEQDHTQATFAGKTTRDDARIDFTRSAEQVGRIIRAHDPRPGAFATHRGADVKCFGARVASVESAAALPGTVVAIDGAGMIVQCGDGRVRITDVQPSGKGRLTPEAWMRGRGVAVGDRFDA